ncbi:hypothetical protein ACS0TY_032904 [Phlomoides rotata]
MFLLLVKVVQMNFKVYVKVYIAISPGAACERWIFVVPADGCISWGKCADEVVSAKRGQPSSGVSRMRYQLICMSTDSANQKITVEVLLKASAESVIKGSADCILRRVQLLAYLKVAEGKSADTFRTQLRKQLNGKRTRNAHGRTKLSAKRTSRRSPLAVPPPPPAVDVPISPPPPAADVPAVSEGPILKKQKLVVKLKSDPEDVKVKRNPGVPVLSYAKSKADQSPILDRFKSDYVIFPGVSFSCMENALKDKFPNGGDDFIRIFILYALLSFLDPSPNRLVITKYLKSLERIAEPITLPLLKHWNMKKVSDRCSEELEAGKYGSGELVVNTYPICLNGVVPGKVYEGVGSKEKDCREKVRLEGKFKDMQEFFISLRKDANEFTDKYMTRLVEIGREVQANNDDAESSSPPMDEDFLNLLIGWLRCFI